MNRNRFVLAFLLALAGLALWLMLRTDPEPPRAAPIGSRLINEVAQVQEGDPMLRREVAGAAALDPVVAKQAPDPTAVSGIPVLHGVVKEIGGDGVSGVLLELMDRDGEPVESTTSGEGGSFSFSRPASDGGVIEVQLWLGHRSRIRSKLPLGRSGGMWRGEATVWIPPIGTIEGTVVDSTGQPVEGAYLISDRTSAGLGGSRMPWAVIEGSKIEIPLLFYSDATGHFVMNYAVRGAHQLRATYGHVHGSVACEAGDRGVVLVLGAPTGAVVIAGRLTTRSTGAPVVGAEVTAILLRETSYSSSRTVVAQVTTDERGYYETTGMPRGKYILSTLPSGYTYASTDFRYFDDGRHTVDFVLDPARNVRVRVVLPDGSIPQGVVVRAIDALGRRLQVPGKMKILADGVSVDAKGWVELRLLPAAPLTILATIDDLSPAGRLEVDLSMAPPESVTIALPFAGKRYTHTHYFKLLGPDGEPAPFEGTVVAKSFDKNVLLSHVEGRWRGSEFVFGHSESNRRTAPVIAVGVLADACRVEITVPGYRQETLTLEPGTRSPTTIRLRR